MLALAALVLPLSLDSFAVAAALGSAGIARSSWLRVSLVLAAFEAGMPVVGVLVGHTIGTRAGSVGELLGAATLLVLGTYMLRSGDDGDARRSRSLARAHGLALIGLGVAISVDELAIGLSIGLLDLPITSAVVIIAGQALVAAQLGLPVGAATSAALRERAEQAAALILIGVGIALVIHHAL